MEDNREFHFLDTTVTFDQFVDSLAIKVALRIHQVEKGQLEIGKLMPSRISPGKKRYKLVDLQQLARIRQNYLL